MEAEKTETQIRINFDLSEGEIIIMIWMKACKDILIWESKINAWNRKFQFHFDLESRIDFKMEHKRGS